MPPATESTRPPRWQLGQALLWIVALTLAMNWPLPAHLGDRSVGPDGDFAFGYWNVWWTAEALGSFENPFHTGMIFHPEGISLLWRDFPVLATAAAAPLSWAFGPMAAYNLIYLATFFLAGWGAYLLGRYLTGSHLAGLGAGVVYAFAPSHFLSYGQQSSSHVQWLPFLLLALLKLRDTGRLRQGVLAGIWLACSLHTGLYFGIYSAMGVVLLGMWCWLVPGDRPADLRRWWRGLAACVATAVLLFAPRGLPMAVEALQGLEIEQDAPGSRAELLGMAVRTERDQPAGLVSWPAFFGWTVLIGAVAATLRSARRTRLWWMIAAVFFFIAMGTTLRVAGQDQAWLPMPADILVRLPLLSSLRGFHRALVIVLLALAVLFAFFLRDLERRAAQRAPAAGRRRPLGAWVLLALFLLEAWPPAAPVRPNLVPPFYAELAAEGGDGAVVPVPLDGAVAVGALERPMFLQTVHGRPLVSGHTSRHDPAQRDKMARSPFLASLLADDPHDPTRPFPVPSPAEAGLLRRDLRERGIDTVVLQLGWIAPPEGPPPRPEGTELEAGAFLLPLWRGPLAASLFRPPRGLPYEPRPARKPWLHPSVTAWLEAVLGPGRRLEDDSVAWRLPR